MVVRQLLLPKEGGGSLRRFLGVRQRLYRDQWKDPRPMRGPMPLFDFRARDDAADLRESLRPGRSRGLFGGWRVSDDSVIGGYSSSEMEFNEGVENKNDAEEKSDTSISPPFLRWSGTISTKINRNSQLARNITRSGFAAVLSPEWPFSAPLGSKYRALEICCRTDGRTYAVNLHVETMFPEDMYQGFIVGGSEQSDQNDENNDNNKNSKMKILLDPSNDADTCMTAPQQRPRVTEMPEPSLDVRTHLKNRQNVAFKKDPNNHPYHGHPPIGFQRLILPFRDLALTSRGRMRHTQRDLDGSVNIESIGFTLMDGEDGDFCFDLVSLRAVNVLEGEVVGTLEDEARDEEFVNSLRAQKKGKDKKDEDSETEKSGTASKS